MLILTAINTTHLAPVSDYMYQVAVNSTLIAAGSVRGHRRSDGWQELIALIARNAGACCECGRKG